MDSMYEKRQTTCKDCGAPIVLMRMRSGRSMSCDARTLRFAPGRGHEAFVTLDGYVRHGKRDNAGVVGLSPHWVSCTAHDEFKKGR